MFWFRKACVACTIGDNEASNVVEQAHLMAGMLLHQGGNMMEAAPFICKAASLGNETAKGFLKEIAATIGMPPIPEAFASLSAKQLDPSVDSTVFEKIKALKQQGNGFFSRKKFGNACKAYDEALELFFALIHPPNAEQRKENVIIYSNKAECLIRQEKHADAILAATEALALDPHHEKSLLRRARATLRLLPTEPDRYSSCHYDLQKTIDLNGASLSDAQDLIKELASTCTK